MGLMDKQTQQAFALGGLKDEGGEIDEASGNRVPIGGTKEGVRDDIPANVSEGEFIFPADVVRYHGLDKMMALRQEAKMGLKQMESMGQMGNSEEATMPDDLPFEMADLIVVGGKGEPMEFANGGFVPSYQEGGDVVSSADSGMEQLETAYTPTVGTDRPRINYDDYMKFPTVTMQEYRNAAGDSIIITTVNGVANMEIPEGYTLYTPPVDTPATTTQAAIQTVNRRSSYRPSGDNEGPGPQPDQPAPNYAAMNDTEFFNYMAEQNSFAGKAGSAAGLAIAGIIGGPVAILVGSLMRSDKNKQLASMKTRIDRMTDGAAKTKALADFKEYGGEIDPEKKQGLLSGITNFLGSLVNDVAGVLGVKPEEAAKVTQQAAGATIGGAVTYDEKVKEARANIISPAQSVTQTGPQLRPDARATAPVTQTGPQGTAIGAFTNQDPRQPTAFPGMGVTTPTVTADDGYGPVTNLDVLAEKAERAAQPTAQQLNEARRYNLDMQGTGGQVNAKNKLPSGPVDIRTPQAGDTRFGTGQPNPAAEAARRSLVRGDKGVIPTAGTGGYDETGIRTMYNPYNVQPPQPTEAEKNLAKFQRDQGFKKTYTATKPNLVRENEPDYTSLEATQQSYGPSQRAGYESDMYAAMQDMPPVNYVTAPAEAGQANRVLQNQPQASVESSYDEVGVQMQDPRKSFQTTSPNRIGTGDPEPSQTQQAFNINNDPYGPSELSGVPMSGNVGFGLGDLPDELSGVPMSGNVGFGLGDLPDELSGVPMSGNVGPTTPTRQNVEPRTMYQGSMEVETAAQRRAKEVQAQQARTQTRNKEIAEATALIPAYIANSKQTQDSIKAGYTGSTTGGYAIGKISGSDGNDAGVVQRADGKVTKVRDLDPNATGQRAAMTVFSDAEGTRYTKSTFGKKTKLNGDKYTGPGITQADKGGAAAVATAKQITQNNVRYNVKDESGDNSGGGGAYSAPADPPGNTGGFTSIRDMFDGGGPGESGAEEVKRGGGDGGSSRVICTELYKQGKLDRELYRMDVVYTAKYLSPITVRGYHYWAIPMVVKMKSSTLLTNVFEYLTIARAKEIAHIVNPKEYKDRSVLGYLIKNVGEAICYSIGLFTDQKDWTVLYNKGAVK